MILGLWLEKVGAVDQVGPTYYDPRPSFNESLTEPLQRDKYPTLKFPVGVAGAAGGGLLGWAGGHYLSKYVNRKLNLPYGSDDRRMITGLAGSGALLGGLLAPHLLPKQTYVPSDMGGKWWKKEDAEQWMKTPEYQALQQKSAGAVLPVLGAGAGAVGGGLLAHRFLAGPAGRVMARILGPAGTTVGKVQATGVGAVVGGLGGMLAGTEASRYLGSPEAAPLDPAQTLAHPENARRVERFMGNAAPFNTVDYSGQRDQKWLDSQLKGLKSSTGGWKYGV